MLGEEGKDRESDDVSRHQKDQPTSQTANERVLLKHKILFPLIFIFLKHLFVFYFILLTYLFCKFNYYFFCEL